MKYLAVLIIAFAAFVAADDEWKPITDLKALQKPREDCKAEVGATTEDADTMLCYFKKIGLFTEDKGYNVDRVIAQLDIFVDDAEKLRDVVKACTKDKEENASVAEWAYSGHQCMMNSKIGDAWKEKEEAEKAAEKA